MTLRPTPVPATAISENCPWPQARFELDHVERSHFICQAAVDTDRLHDLLASLPARAHGP